MALTSDQEDLLKRHVSELLSSGDGDAYADVYDLLATKSASEQLTILRADLDDKIALHNDQITRATAARAAFQADRDKV